MNSIDVTTNYRYLAISFPKKNLEMFSDLFNMLDYTIRNFGYSTVVLLFWSCDMPSFIAVIWHPQYKCYIDRIQRVQNKFLRFLAFENGIVIINHDYSRIKKVFGMLTLKNCKLISDFLMLHKIVKGRLLIPSILQCIPF